VIEMVVLTVVKKIGKEDELKVTLEKAKRNNLLRVVKVYRDCLEKGRCRIKTDNGDEVIINLKGIVLDDGDVLETDKGVLVLVRLKEEKVLEFSLENPIEAFKLGFAIGNFHMPVMLVGDKVYISAEIQPQFLLERFKEYTPKLKEIVFKPNLQVPVSTVVIDFANS